MKTEEKHKKDKVKSADKESFQKKRRLDDAPESGTKPKKFKPVAHGKSAPNRQAKASAESVAEKKLLACRNCGSTDHLMRDCPKPKTCFLCHTSDHDHSQCPKNPKRKDLPKDACRACGQVGHVKRLCPNKPTHSYGGAAVCFVCQGPHLARYCSQNAPVEKRTCRICKAVGHIKADCPQASKKIVFGKEGKETKANAKKDSGKKDKASDGDKKPGNKKEKKADVPASKRDKKQKSDAEGPGEKSPKPAKESKKEKDASGRKDVKTAEAGSKRQKAK